MDVERCIIRCHSKFQVLRILKIVDVSLSPQHSLEVTNAFVENCSCALNYPQNKDKHHKLTDKVNVLFRFGSLKVKVPVDTMHQSSQSAHCHVF